MPVRAAERNEIRGGLDLEALTRIVHALTIAVGDGQLLPYLDICFQVVDQYVPPERLTAALMGLVVSGMGATPKEEEDHG